MSCLIQVYNKTIKPLADICNNQLAIISRENFKYKSDISFKDLLYTSIRINGPNQSYSTVLSEMKCDNILSVTKSALIKKRQRLSYTVMENLNDKILDHIYDNISYRLLAVDGTVVYFPISFKNELPLCNNKQCCIGLISIIYDIERKIPINYSLPIDRNERSVLLKQLVKLKQGDIVVHDRGYYSKELLYQYHMIGINVIFRLNSGLRYVKQIRKSRRNDIIITEIINGRVITIRILKYKIDSGKGKRNYYIATTLTDKHLYPIDFIKEAYHKRWEVETHIRNIKLNMSLTDIRSKSLNGVKQDIAAIQFLSMISSFIEYSLTQTMIKKDQHKINTKNCMQITASHFIKWMFYGKNQTQVKDKLIFLLKIIKESIIAIQHDRTYKRIRKRPPGKWRTSGSVSGRPLTEGCKRMKKKKHQSTVIETE